MRRRRFEFDSVLVDNFAVPPRLLGFVFESALEMIWRRRPQGDADSIITIINDRRARLGRAALFWF
jgi:hypothetical protein